MKVILYTDYRPLALAMSIIVDCSFTMTEPSDGQWGAFSNGTYTGLVGQLHRKVSSGYVLASIRSSVGGWVGG